MGAPQLIHGQGTDACPSGSFCLYRDVDFNNGSESGNDKILVIPEGAYINNFSDYGFDHSDDGVSGVFNNTEKDNTLFTQPSQGGHTLPVAKRQAIADLTKMPLSESPTGTWNDQAQSALAAPYIGNLGIDQQFLSHWQDWESQKWIYSFRLTLHAAQTPVRKWSVGFGDLPVGTVLYKQFSSVFWGKIIEDGSNGTVLLESPDGETHIVEPGKVLEIDIQILYPGENTAYQQLNSLNAQQLG
ncbi:hypothetical protein GCM10027280_51600 [Micromonospora polyrhachis]|uniref:Peptidase inhibitor family I36 n=1 Tax=Micromonospora polyrhachis TaxID=1282883 RepID=A0A7W7SYI1_9ACTN|nr:peptidase inhibitor family I36 protein [Micromonospora polyrhachis]MBB4961995.1 hypothetical protein [Micromonospora polyrhachis]